MKKPSLTLLMLTATLLGCSGGGAADDGASGTTGDSVCEPGKTDACACPGGDPGVQVCADDGTRWETCECGSTSTSDASSTDTSSTTAGSGSGSTGGTGTGGSGTGPTSSTGGSTGGSGTGASSTGAVSECSVLQQDCPTGDACYVSLTDGLETCSQPTPDAGDQGDPCEFLNSCVEGAGCILQEQNSTNLVCARYCATDGGFPFCARGFDCRQVNVYYNNAGVGDDVGMCVPDTWP